LQRGDGFFGPLVIKSAQDPSASEYDYDLNDHIMVLNDWFDTPVSQKFTYYVHSDTTGSMPTSILINGKGFSKNANFTAPKAVFHVKAGKRYRFRVIDASVGYCPLQISIENHDLTVIATDGNAVEPTKVKSIVLNAGNLKTNISKQRIHFFQKKFDS
jgi:L-ascorbate oxidase